MHVLLLLFHLFALVAALLLHPLQSFLSRRLKGSIKRAKSQPKLDRTSSFRHMILPRFRSADQDRSDPLMKLQSPPIVLLSPNGDCRALDLTWAGVTIGIGNQVLSSAQLRERDKWIENLQRAVKLTKAHSFISL
ncbi:ras/Rap GTPase-activating protein SynGAP-like protein [Lates japonicus]|uniref:Ras/Rap GTPase-activating protein SynGAP-like protein n=1 Tax=Lates japonicus TaxID=270547 RepID=A0AAD3MHU9_LATJO|nr:ras/Rap GTPase-activating protein SynGAP-like protein [Lates japonicus]